MMSDLGLTDWGVRHGLATKLVMLPQPLLESQNYTKGSPEMGAERFDVARSMALYDSVYTFRGFQDRAIWADRSTLNIVWQFYAVALQLAVALERWGGSPAGVERLRIAAAGFQVAAEGGFAGRPGA